MILINPLFLIIHLSDLCNLHRAQIKEEKHVKANLSPDLNSLSLTPERSSFGGSKIKLSGTSPCREMLYFPTKGKHFVYS